MQPKKNEKVDLKIDSKSGEIISWVFNGKAITNQPIRPNFWRPPTDNDLGNGMDKWAKIWQEATYNNSANLSKTPCIDRNRDGYVFEVNYKLPNEIAEANILFNIF